MTRLAMAELALGEAVSGQPSAVSDQLRAEGTAHLDFAIEEFRAMKMQPALERALRHKGILNA